MATSSPSRFGIDVYPLCLGGNVFGWTADKAQSFEVLDAYAAAGGNFVDTADVYMIEGGESESILGAWMSDRGNRDDLVIATKVAKKKDRRGLGRENIRLAIDESLQRLETHRVDLYWCHEEDPHTPLVETFETLNELVEAGTVGAIGLSNFEPDTVRAVIQTCADHGWTAPVALQPDYSLMERDFETTLQPVAAELGLGVMPYFSLASGFLTGKYREKGDDGAGSQRAEGARKYLERHNAQAVLTALDEIAAAHDVTGAAVALAWLRAQDTIVAPIASARTVEQLDQILPMATLELTDDEVRTLGDAAA